MKILLVYNNYQDPGGEEVVFGKERHLLEEGGHEVFEYRRHNNEIKNYSTLKRLSLIGRTVWASDSYRDFTALLQEKKPDVVHVHNTFPLISPSIFWACRSEGVPSYIPFTTIACFVPARISFARENPARIAVTDTIGRECFTDAIDTRG